MAPKNILYIHETARFSGAEESLLNLARFLDREKYRPVFVLPEEGVFSRKLTASGVPVFFAPMPRIRDVKGVAAAAARIRDIAVKNHAAVIHTNSIRSHLYGAYAAKSLHLPLVWHERNLVTTERIDPERVLSFLPDAIICNATAIARRFARKGKLPEKVQVIHNGVDVDRFSPSVDGRKMRAEFKIGPDELVIGIASRFAPDKGHETFLRAARMLCDAAKGSGSPIRFLVVGGAVFAEDMRQEERLRALAAELGFKEKVVFAGVRDEMPEAYAAMDIFVLASDAEPCGRVLFESMALGKPVVATTTGGTPEIVADGVTGILVRPRDPGELSRALKTLVDDPEQRRAMGQAARTRIEELFTIEQNVRKIEAVYRELLDL